MGHDAGPDRRLRRGRVRLRVAAARQRPDHQRGRHRPRRRRARPRARRRSTSASSRRRAARTSCASPAARCCRRRSTATSSAGTARRRRSTSCRAIRRRSATSASDSARSGRSAPRPPSTSRWCRRSSASRTDASRAPSRTPRPRPCSSRPSSWAARSPSWPTSRPARRRRSMSRSSRSSWASSSRTRSSARCSSATRARWATDAARLYARHTIVDQLTFDPNMGFTGQLPSDGPVILAWSDHELLPVEIEGVDPAPDGQRPVVPADGRRDQRHDDVPQRPAALDRHLVATRRSSARTRSRINFGRGTAELAYRPIAFEGTFEATAARDRPQLRGPGLRRRPQAHRAAAGHPASRARSRRSTAARCRTSTGCPKSSCTT